MQTLFVRKLYLWPRFHSLIESSLNPPINQSEPNKFEVVELTIPLSLAMTTVQNAILSALETCINELKRLFNHLSFFFLCYNNNLTSSPC